VIFIGQLVVVQFGGEFFRTVPLSIKDWAFIVALSSVVLWIGEIWRWIERVRSKNVLSGTPREGMLRS
ncbi:MAG: cation transporting ATPase C-terminal domain-containing protein, partial [Thermodesulforhabdaceae bacterium]